MSLKLQVASNVLLTKLKAQDEHLHLTQGQKYRSQASISISASLVLIHNDSVLSLNPARWCMLSSQRVKDAIIYIFANCFMNVYKEGWPTCDSHTSFCFFMTDVTVSVKAVLFLKCQ